MLIAARFTQLRKIATVTKAREFYFAAANRLQHRASAAQRLKIGSDFKRHAVVEEGVPS
ncbi:hypothetical protein [Sinorhizobium fredii]|uniref:Uncharacterized protein n=1 Tax=Rhizobium fredii TaxID=380 RepID=A0A844AAM3_RHIFR|nr:hypothetical protein [Sinorhizobium fredii]ASY73328.1 hypothetical protein SF83666_b66790 [Sinorhizobium fredii CCBAU 83666]AWM27615.1 hypothetical protein AOX55_00004836 [Sinorhizobium fredii CCBAU 25509]MQW96599.1 hypothetical protein [Sinorhizobium fredii]MQX09567.1 hypothetical protein [Sinorhizobium fredii]